MLDLTRYLLGVVEILLLAGFATLGGTALRRWLLPDFRAAPARLATAVLALGLLLLVAELLGSVGLFEPLPYLVAVAAVAVGTWLGVGRGRGCPSGWLGFSPRSWAAVRGWGRGEKQDAAAPEGHPRPAPTNGRSSSSVDGWSSNVATVVGLAIAVLALVKFGLDVRPNLTTGMTGFDSTWYHAPFAAGFLQSGSTWDLHFIAPQFLAWFYPANAELFHGVGMLAFGRDLLSPLLNVGWFVGCLLACWCIGRPYRVAPWSLALGAIALSLPVLSDQAGEARNDIVGIFFLLAAVAIALNARLPAEARPHAQGSRASNAENASEADDGSRTRDFEPGAVLVIGLAAGLAAGTKLNFLPPAAVLVLGLPFVAPAGRRRRAFAVGAIGALAGGGYWYLRNLFHGGNPLPWVDSIGPISLPAPDQALGGREGHSVLGYLADGAVWSDWFLPGLHNGLTFLWPLLAAAAVTGLFLSLISPRRFSATRSSFEPHSDPNLYRDRVLPIVGLVGLAALLAWLIAPTSASGPDGMPRGFESGLRYLAPALVLGLAVLPLTLLPRVAWGGAPGKARRPVFRPANADRGESAAGEKPSAVRAPHPATGPAGRWRALAVVAVLAAIAIGYPVQRHYLENRYANPTFAAPGLNAAFAWATPLSDARIATTSTRQYPLYGTDLSNHVQYIGEEQPHGGFTAPTTCRRWRELLNKGDYDYVVASRDRIEPNKPPYPPAATWTAGPGAEPIFRKPPTIIYKLTTPQDPSACPRSDPLRP
ncbi:MAG: hypothetical protein WDZ46_00660 [Solirubrobacterales bacterium]